MARALEGLGVLEVGEFISAPYCAKMMADMGAEVIKVERPDGGDEARRHGPFTGDVPHPEKSGLFLYLNANKLGITLDLRKPAARTILHTLLRQADVLVHNHAPREAAALGLEFQSLHRMNPQLIVAAITPFGSSGPYSGYTGYDINVCALSGITHAVGKEGREPLTPPYFQADYQAAVSATAATMVALLAREVTGRGQFVDVAAFEIWATIHHGSAISTLHHQGQRRSERVSQRRRGLYPYTFLPCKDGQMFLIAQDGHQWKRFIVDILKSEELATNPRYRDRRKMGMEYPEEVDALITPWMRERTRQEIFQLCMEHRVPFAPVRTMGEVLEDPHLEHRGFFQEMDSLAGRLRVPGAPYRFSHAPWELRHPSPSLGQHNEEVLCRRLGYNPKDVEQFREAGVI